MYSQEIVLKIQDYLGNPVGIRESADTDLCDGCAVFQVLPVS